MEGDLAPGSPAVVCAEEAEDLREHRRGKQALRVFWIWVIARLSQGTLR